MVRGRLRVLDRDARCWRVGRKVNDSHRRFSALRYRVGARVRHGIRARIRVGPRAGVGMMCMHGDCPRIRDGPFVGGSDEIVGCRKHRARRAPAPGLASGYAAIRARIRLPRIVLRSMSRRSCVRPCRVSRDELRIRLVGWLDDEIPLAVRTNYPMWDSHRRVAHGAGEGHTYTAVIGRR